MSRRRRNHSPNSLFNSYQQLEKRELLAATEISPQFDVELQANHEVFEVSETRSIIVHNTETNVVWVHDGASATATPVQILDDGLWFDRGSFRQVESGLAFESTDGEQELTWITDGTYEGTTLQTSVVDAVTVGGKELYVEDREYYYDGRLLLGNGTAPEIAEIFNEKIIFSNSKWFGVADPSEGIVNTFGQDFAVYADNVFYVVYDGLYQTDGTVASIERILPDYNVSNVFAYEDELYFIGRDGSQRGIWQTDGTATGTEKVFDSGYSPEDMFVWQGYLVFQESNRIWLFDGETTELFIDDFQNAFFSETEVFVEDQSSLYRKAIGDADREWMLTDDSIDGAEFLYHRGSQLVYRSSDGIQVANLDQGETSFLIPAFRELGGGGTFVNVGGDVYGMTTDPPFGYSPVVWKRDGQTGETTILAEVINFSNDLFHYSDHLYFFESTFNGSGETNIRKINLLNDQIETVFTIDLPIGNIYRLGSGPGLFIFSGPVYSKLFHLDLDNKVLSKFEGRFDGGQTLTENGDLLFQSYPNLLRMGQIDGAIENLGSLSFDWSYSNSAADLHFFASDYEIWASDGTEPGTKLVHQLAGQTFGYKAGIVGDSFFYQAEVDSTNLVQVWAANSTTLGAIPVIDGHLISEVVELDGLAYFLQEGKLVQSDGTPEGTIVVGQLPVTSQHYSSQIYEIDGKILFGHLGTLYAYDPSHASLGTLSVGASQLKVIPGLGFVYSANGKTYVSDGTPAGTRSILDRSSEVEQAGWDGETLTIVSETDVVQTDDVFEDYIAVFNSDDSGPGSFREAIELSEIRPGRDVIKFDLLPFETIQLSSPLPEIFDSLEIRGALVDSESQIPWVTIDGSNAGVNANGLTIRGDDVLIQGIALTGFDRDAILIANADNVEIKGVYIGVTADGIAMGNGRHGIHARNTQRLDIKGNVISNNASNGIFLVGESTYSNVHANLIGAGPDGETPMGNMNGIVLYSSYNWIDGNTVLGNQRNGIAMYNETGHSNTFVNNQIGFTLEGVVLGNGTHGIYSVSDNNHIGRDRGVSGSFDGNYIGGNTFYGVYLSGSNQTLVTNNRIGFEWYRSIQAGNGAGGVRVGGSPGVGINLNHVGSNQGAGVFVGGVQTSGFNISSNLVGYHSLFGNIGTGLIVNSAIDGFISGNTIKDNKGGGFLATGGETRFKFKANIVGSPDISLSSSNDNYGVYVNSHGNQFFGGNSFANESGNFIVRGNDNSIRDNVFGDPENELDEFYTPNNLFLVGTASNNQVFQNSFDDAYAAIRNRSNGLGNRFTQNSMMSNLRNGIDNGPLGLDENDQGDFDNGPNRLQNSPVLLDVFAVGSSLSLTYFVDTTSTNSSIPLTIEFFIASANRIGETFLGADTYNLEDLASGEKSISLNLDIELESGTRIVATATDEEGNSSEFSIEAVVS